MSSENNTTSGLAGVIANLKSNPKALAIAGGVLALVLFLIFKGSDDEGVTAAKVVPVSIGQKVTIQNPNVGNTILLAAPGAVGLADSENDQDDMIVCKRVLSGTTATLNEETTVNYIPFAKVTLESGDCLGKTGWMPKVNLK
ncbi:MAG: hypothetical protein NTX45_23835 [Proteobacteria bacterium]|nr:hypothetical protein [Pseudomonadota bacterium]